MKQLVNDNSLLALHYVYPLTFKKYTILLAEIETLNNLAYTTPTNLARILQMTTKKAHDLLDHYHRMVTVDLLAAYQSKNIKPIPFTSSFYPKSLLDLVDPPLILYVKGNEGLLTEQKKIAVIGSRNATKYSSIALDYIVPPLVEQNYIIVSGLARGADSLAHSSTIKYGGKTIGILGHGLFHMYPKENTKLAEEMIENHLLITEYPPYIGPKKWHFPMRNRIISGMSNALIVTEASLKSGTLITTDHALEHGKDVFAVPGPIHSEQSLGTNNLIREGAIPVWNGYQILEQILNKY